MTQTHLHFDCFSGISGDMLLGALVDLGAPLAEIERQLAALPIGPFSLRAEKLMRQGIEGTRVHVEVQEDPHAHRHLRHVIEIIDRAADLPARVAERARRAFTLLAEAEARVHGTTIERVHFHEVGARDAIVDITGAMLGVELLGIESFSASTVTAGSGTVRCQHGVMPVPAPATAELLRGLPWQAGPVASEMATPTGIAILRALLGEPPAPTPPDLCPARIGYGAGSKEFKELPNYLRLWLCEAAAAGPALPVRREHVLVLECEIDNMPAETAGYLMERLLEAGALDAHFAPVQMKKNRPGIHLRVIAEPRQEAELATLIFAETTTLGLRRSLTERWALERELRQVQTELGPVRVKLALWDDRVLRAVPEFEDCRELARRHARPLAEVTELARAAARADQA